MNQRRAQKCAFAHGTVGWVAQITAGRSHASVKNGGSHPSHSREMGSKGGETSLSLLRGRRGGVVDPRTQTWVSKGGETSLSLLRRRRGGVVDPRTQACFTVICARSGYGNEDILLVLSLSPYAAGRGKVSRVPENWVGRGFAKGRQHREDGFGLRTPRGGVPDARGKERPHKPH